MGYISDAEIIFERTHTDFTNMIRDIQEYLQDKLDDEVTHFRIKIYDDVLYNDTFLLLGTRKTNGKIDVHSSLNVESLPRHVTSKLCFHNKNLNIRQVREINNYIRLENCTVNFDALTVSQTVNMNNTDITGNELVVLGNAITLHDCRWNDLILNCINNIVIQKCNFQNIYIRLTEGKETDIFLIDNVATSLTLGFGVHQEFFNVNGYNIKLTVDGYVKINGNQNLKIKSFSIRYKNVNKKNITIKEVNEILQEIFLVK
jgi:hypothetical protein